MVVIVVRKDANGASRSARSCQVASGAGPHTVFNQLANRHTRTHTVRHIHPFVRKRESERKKKRNEDTHTTVRRGERKRDKHTHTHTRITLSKLFAHVLEERKKEYISCALLDKTCMLKLCTCARHTNRGIDTQRAHTQHTHRQTDTYVHTHVHK